MTFRPQEIECPDPTGCPVVPDDDLPPLPAVTVPANTPLYRCYDGKWGYDEPNPGHGDARFSPFDSIAGQRVSTLYLGDTPLAALLETVFHDVHNHSSRLVYDTSLRNSLLVHVLTPSELRLADLRDAVLDDLGLDRVQVASSPSEHYPCTRRLAQRLYEVGADGESVDGILWHSRQAELHDAGQAEVIVVFTDRLDPGRGQWTRVGPGSRNLYEGPDRLLVEQIALEIDATIVTS